MAEIPYHDELEVALEAVQRAAVLTKTVMQGIDSYDKSDASPVTIADFAAQAIIICAIKHAYPEDGFIAEESSEILRKDPAALDKVWELVQSAKNVESTLPAPIPEDKDDMCKYIDLGSSPEGPKAGRIWILDPIDGTATFMKLQQYAVALCLTIDGEQKVAVLGCPNLPPIGDSVSENITDLKDFGALVYATVGGGAYKAYMTERDIGTRERLRRRRGSLKGDVNISDLVFIDSEKSSHADPESHKKVYESLNIKQKPVDLWSMQMKYVALAFGETDAMFRIPPNRDYRSCVWDHAGGQLIYEEAGGMLTDARGERFQFGQARQFKDNFGYVAADKEVHGQLLEAVKRVLSEQA